MDFGKKLSQALRGTPAKSRGIAPAAVHQVREWQDATVALHEASDLAERAPGMRGHSASVALYETARSAALVADHLHASRHYPMEAAIREERRRARVLAERAAQYEDLISPAHRKWLDWIRS